MSSVKPTVHTQGGAGFGGDLKAKRDINIFNISGMRPLAHDLHYSFFTLPEMFQQVQPELALLQVALDTVKENLETTTIKDSLLFELDEQLQGCHRLLSELQSVKDHFESVRPQTQRTWEREGWKLDQLQSIRARLSLLNDILNMINYNMIRSSPAHVLRSLELIIDEFRNGKRANSAISSESLSTNEEEAWKQLRDELRSMGISQDALSRHQHLIMATLTEAINNEKREDNIYFDQDRERDLDEKEEMKGRPQSANGDSIDQMSQDGNPKSVPQVRVKQAKRASWVPRFVYKAMKTNEKNSSQKLLGKQSLEGELDENELFQAAAKGDVDKIYLLVKNGADLNMKNREQDTLLVFSARYGHEFLVRVLLQVEVGYKYDKDDCGKALSVAAESGHKGVVQALVKQGPVVVDWVDHVDDKGLTALHKAAASGHERIVQMILESRASVHMLDYLDDTALHKAVKSDRLNIIRLFLKRGAEVDAKAYAEASEGGLEIIRRYIH